MQRPGSWWPLMSLPLMVVVIAICASAASAQEVHRQQKVAGTHLTSGRDLYAEVFTFPERVEHAFYDDERNVISVLLRGLTPRNRLRNNGSVVVYDLGKAKLRWSRKVQYFGNNIFQPRGYFIENRGLNTTASHIGSGAKAWRLPHEVYFVSENLGMAVGYNTRNGRWNSSTLAGVDIASGKPVWDRSISRQYGWNDLQQLNDSVYLVLASGLHKVNIKTGDGWSYHTVTGEKRTGNVISNVLESDGDYFMASKIKLSRLDAATGRIKWSSSYPEELASSSALFADDSTVYMLNTGRAASYFGTVRYGQPFFAAYNKVSGLPRYFVPLEKEEEPVYQHAELDNVVLMLRLARLEAYAKTTGKCIAQQVYEDDLYGVPIQFLPAEEVYTKKPDGTFATLFSQDSLHTFVLFNSGMVMAFDASLNKAYMLDLDAIWVYNDEAEGHVLVSDGERTMVLDGKGTVEAELISSGGSLYPDRRLLYYTDDQCYLLDLTQVIRNKP